MKNGGWRTGALQNAANCNLKRYSFAVFSDSSVELYTKAQKLLI